MLQLHSPTAVRGVSVNCRLIGVSHGSSIKTKCFEIHYIVMILLLLTFAAAHCLSCTMCFSHIEILFSPLKCHDISYLQVFANVSSLWEITLPPITDQLAPLPCEDPNLDIILKGCVLNFHSIVYTP